MPPISGIDGAFGSGASVIVTSVVMIIPPTCAAIAMLLRSTFAGSTIPKY